MENMYKAPESNLENKNTDLETHPFYVVSVKKFLSLYICTMGIYMVFWMYKNWQLIKSQSKLDCWPVARAIFGIFFFHDLYRRVDHQLKENNEDSKWYLNYLATTTVLILIVNRIIIQVTSKNETVGALNYLSIIFFFVSAGVVGKAQKSINKASEDEFGETNCHFSAFNIICTLLGFALWVLILASLVVPPESLN